MDTDEQILGRIRAQAEKEEVRITQHAHQEMVRKKLVLMMSMNAWLPRESWKIIRSIAGELLLARRLHQQRPATPPRLHDLEACAHNYYSV
jgi:hypothetical protein